MSSLKSTLVVAALLLLAACSSSQPSALRAATTPAPDVAASPSPSLAASASPAPAAPAAAAPAALTCSKTRTPAQTEGPYFKAGSSARASLVDPGMAGTRLALSGRVTDIACQPLVNVKLDFWQANANGQYDNSGYRLRGFVTTDAAGNYRIETIVPGLYTGRTEHIHVKVEPAGGAVLTTQLYFPGVVQNDSDGIYNPALLMTITAAGGGESGTYNFII